MLYNALNMSHYENPDDLEIITLYNALFLEQRNENILKYGLVKIPTPAELTLQKGKLTKANLPFWFYAFNTL